MSTADDFDELLELDGEDQPDDQPKVRRELSAEAITEREQRLAQMYMEVCDLREAHLQRAQRVRTLIRERDEAMRKLATEIKERAEWVPAQLELADAVRARDAQVRGTKRPGASSQIK